MFIKKKEFLEIQEENAQLSSKVFNLENDLTVKSAEYKSLKEKYDALEKKYNALKNGEKETGEYCATCKYGRQKGLDILRQFWCMKSVPCKDYEPRKDY